jgi:hypothetical protein
MRIDNLYPTPQELLIKDGLGNLTDIKLKLVGIHSRQVRDVARRIHKETLGKDDVETLEKANAEIYATCITGWEGIENADGPVPYTHQKAVEYLLTPELYFIREQVEEFVQEKTNFFRKGNESVGSVGATTGVTQHAQRSRNLEKIAA